MRGLRYPVRQIERQHEKAPGLKALCITKDKMEKRLNFTILLIRFELLLLNADRQPSLMVSEDYSFMKTQERLLQVIREPV